MREIKRAALTAIFLSLSANTLAHAQEIDECGAITQPDLKTTCEIEEILKINNEYQIKVPAEKRFRPVYLSCDIDGSDTIEFINRDRDGLQVVYQGRYSGERLSYVDFSHINPDNSRQLHFRGSVDEIVASGKKVKQIRHIQAQLMSLHDKICHGSEMTKKNFMKILSENKSLLRN